MKITVNRLVDEPKSLWGEWTIKANFPGLPVAWAQIHHEGNNLLSGVGKKRMAKVLTDMYQSTPWTTIIDKTAELVIAKLLATSKSGHIRSREIRGWMEVW